MLDMLVLAAIGAVAVTRELVTKYTLTAMEKWVVFSHSTNNARVACWYERSVHHLGPDWNISITIGSNLPTLTIFEILILKFSLSVSTRGHNSPVFRQISDNCSHLFFLFVISTCFWHCTACIRPTVSTRITIQLHQMSFPGGTKLVTVWAQARAENEWMSEWMKTDDARDSHQVHTRGANYSLFVPEN